ncbi:MAG: nickel-dependent hydrogenase large subunit [Thiohalomonadaceae bacterium]
MISASAPPHAEGSLDIELACRGAAVERVSIRSGRPLRASRILENTTPDEALARIPLVFSVCATAQCEAALGACEQALGITPAPEHRRARAMLVWMETAREHLLRILLDWSGFVGEEVPSMHLPQLIKLLPRLKGALYGEATPFALHSRPTVDAAALEEAVAALSALNVLILGSDGDSPLRTRADFDDWVARGEVLPARLLRLVRERGWDRLGRGPCRWLPELPKHALQQRMAADDDGSFIAAPTWQDGPCETTALERQREQPLIAELLASEGNGLLTRLAARLVELARIPQLLRQEGEAMAHAVPVSIGAADPGMGLAQVEAARGRLAHYVEIAQGKVRRFRILAPTEWNFHPQGVAACGLMTLDGRDEETVQRQGALWLNAIDPCVGFRLRRTAHA